MSETQTYALSQLQLREVSLVDSPANQHAHMLLTKRAPTKSQPRIVVGFAKDNSSALKSVHFGEDWTQEEATKWLEASGLASRVVTTHSLAKGMLATPDKFENYRVLVPGEQLLKALRASLSFDAMRTKLMTALQEAYPYREDDYLTYVFVRELFQDCVIFEQGGQLWKVDYKFDDGTVTLSPRVAVEVAYQELRAPADARGKASPSAELQKQVNSLYLETELGSLIASAKR